MIRPECHYHAYEKVESSGLGSEQRICVDAPDLGNKVEFACELTCVGWLESRVQAATA